MKSWLFIIMLSFLFVLPNVSSATSMSMGIADDNIVALPTDYSFLEKHKQAGIDWSKPAHTGTNWPYGHLPDWQTNRDHRPRSPHCQPTPTPIPAAGWLFATGIVGLYGIKRKMKK